MDFMDESVDDLYNSPEMIEAMDRMEEASLEEPQDYGVHEATLFDEF